MTELDIIVRAAAAVVAGGLIGLERSYRGRAAGLRTNALVALAASLLVAMSEYAGSWTAAGTGDPTRVIQGIVTGIGFLGAGVIIKEGFSVRGLTTAAAVWAVAALGVAFGAGLYVTAIATTFLTWAALELLRQVENKMPVRAQVHCQVGFAREEAPDPDQVRAMVEAKGLRVTEISCRLDAATQLLEYDLVMWSQDSDAPADLAHALRREAHVRSFRITPTRD